MFGQDTNQQTTMGAPAVQNPTQQQINYSAGSASSDATFASETTAQQQPAGAPVQGVGSFSGFGTTSSPMPQPVAEPSAFKAPTPNESPLSANPVNDPVTQPAQEDYLTALTSPTNTDSPVSSTPPATTLTPTANTSEPTKQASTSGPADSQKLADLKKDALTHLEPLSDHVGGTPEETFRATMMMIQANDNHTLLEKALTAAKNIPDDKQRAEALLDIINEINYFAQNSSASSPQN